jgi:hypothetical protein
MQQPSLSSSPIFAFFGLLFDFGLNLAENCFVTSNARTVDWQAEDCVLLANAELQTVLGQLKRLPAMLLPSLSSSTILAFFELLSDFGLILADNCFVTSNARTVDWQAGDCVLLS